MEVQKNQVGMSWKFRFDWFSKEKSNCFDKDTTKGY